MFCFFPQTVNSFPMLRGRCISFQDVVQAFVESNNFIMQNPFIGIIENLRFPGNL